MSEIDLKAWKSFQLVFINFLNNQKAENYYELINEILINSSDFGCMSKEQGKKNRQLISTIEISYQGRWGMHSMADNCWNL